MICALTVRHLKSGTFEEFREAFMRPLHEGGVPDGLKHFNMLRNPVASRGRPRWRRPQSPTSDSPWPSRRSRRSP
jgi:hypothetical protein